MAPCRPRCAGRAGGRGSRRSVHTACATRWPARWWPPESRWPTSPRCCATTACRPRPFTAEWAWTGCGPWPRRGREACSDERAGQPRGGLPAAAPGAGVQAGARRAAAAPAGGLPGGRGRQHGNQRPGDRLGPAARRHTEPLGAAPGRRPRLRPLPADDRPGGRGAAAGSIPRPAAPARSLPVQPARYQPDPAGGPRAAPAAAGRHLRGDLRADRGVRHAHRRGHRAGPRRRRPRHRRHHHPRGQIRPLPAGAAARDRLCPRPRSAAFFLSGAGTRLDRSGAGATFRKITADLGIRTAAVRPRVHDLRHSFAVQTLVRWQRARVNIDERIGTLSTYLGHVAPADTYWYLSASPELMSLAAERLAELET